MDRITIRTGVERFTVHAEGALAEVCENPTELAKLRAEAEGFLAQVRETENRAKGAGS